MQKPYPISDPFPTKMAKLDTLLMTKTGRRKSHILWVCTYLYSSHFVFRSDPVTYNVEIGECSIAIPQLRIIYCKRQSVLQRSCTVEKSTHGPWIFVGHPFLMNLNPSLRIMILIMVLCKFYFAFIHGFLQ